MSTFYLKNTSGSTVNINDLGLSIPNNRSIVIDSNAINGYLSPNLSSALTGETLVLSTTDIGDAGGDLEVADAIKALTITTAFDTNNPHDTTLTQVISADSTADVDLTVSNLNTLVDDSDASTLHNHNTDYYTKTQLETDGQATVDWGNLANVPMFGSLKWQEPVICTLHGMDTDPPSSPEEGWFYIDTDDNHLYKYVSFSWVDQGAPTVGDRVIYRDGASSDDEIYQWSGSAWVGTAPADNWAVLVDDDGDGSPAQYVYDDDEVPPDWIKIADVNWGDHSVLAGRTDADSHPATAISFDNTIKNILAATTVQAAIDEISTEQGVDIDNIYFVAQNGDDDAVGVTVGTLANPFGTVQGAIDAVPTIGGGAASSTNRYIIFVMPGDYSETITLSKAWVYIVGAGIDAVRIKSSSGTTLTLSCSTSDATGCANVTLISDSSTTTDNALLVTGNKPLLRNVKLVAASGARTAYFNGAYTQQVDNVEANGGTFRIDAGTLTLFNTHVLGANTDINGGTVKVYNGEFVYNGGDAITQDNGTVYLVSARLVSGAGSKDYNQGGGTVYWGWVEYDTTKTTFSGTKTLLFKSVDLFYSNTTSGLAATTAQGAIDEVSGDIGTVAGDLSDHVGDTANPHSTTLTQAISADGSVDADLTVTNLNTLVDDSNADALHIHSAGATTYTNTTSGLLATDVQAAIDEVDGNVDDVTGDLSTHTGDTNNPHSTTLTQAISADGSVDADLTVSNLNTLVDDSNADALHIHSAAAITYDNNDSDLVATDVQEAIDELDAKFDHMLPKGTEFPTSPTPADGDLFYRTDLNLTFQYDVSRTKWLSITQMFLDWGSSNADGVYLNIHGALATQTGYLMPRQGTILTITAKTASGNLSKGLQIHRNHDNVTPLQSFSLSSGSYSSISEDIDFDAGDYLQVYANSTGSAARDLVVMITVAWNGT